MSNEEWVLFITQTLSMAATAAASLSVCSDAPLETSTMISAQLPVNVTVSPHGREL